MTNHQQDDIFPFPKAMHDNMLLTGVKPAIILIILSPHNHLAHNIGKSHIDFIICQKPRGKKVLCIKINFWWHTITPF